MRLVYIEKDYGSMTWFAAIAGILCPWKAEGWMVHQDGLQHWRRAVTVEAAREDYGIKVLP